MADYMSYNDQVDQLAKLKRAFVAADKAGDTEVAMSFLKDIETLEMGMPKGDASRVRATDIGINAVTGGLGEALPNAVISGIETLKGNGGYLENYRKRRDQRQADVGAYWKENPKTAALYSGLGTIVGGSKASGALRTAGAKALPGAAKYLTKSGTLPALARYGAAIGEGGALGGYAASGMGEDIGEGVKTGAAATAIIYPAINLAVWAKNNFSTAGKVNKTVAEMAKRSGKSKDQIVTEMQEAQRLGKREYTMADALGDETGGRTLFAMTGNQSPAGNEARRTLMQRNIGQSRRVVGDVQQAAGTKSTQAQIDKLTRLVRRNEAKLNYPAAEFAANIKGVDVSGPLQYLDSNIAKGAAYKSPVAKQAVNWAKRLNMTFGKPVATPVRDFKTLHQMKIDLDGLTAQAYKDGNGPLGNFYSGLRDQMDDALVGSSPMYRKARDTYRIQSNALDALKRGQQMKNARPADIIDAVKAERGPAARRNFGVGLVDPQLKSIENASPKTGAANKMLSDKWQDVLPEVYPNGRGQNLVRQLQIEQQMTDTGNKVLTGSPTAERLMDAGSVGEMAVDAVTGNRTGVMRRILGEALDFASGNNQAVKDQLIKILMENSPAEAQRIIAQAELAGKVARGSASKIAAAYGGGAAWLNSSGQMEQRQ